MKVFCNPLLYLPKNPTSLNKSYFDTQEILLKTGITTWKKKNCFRINFTGPIKKKALDDNCWNIFKKE